MSNQKVKSFSFSFESSKTQEEIYHFILQVKNWWSGLHAEVITGQSAAVGDEFSFSAGNGMHFSIHKLIELIPFSKIVWEVTESNLSFLTNTSEWVGTKICFDIEKLSHGTKVTFTHIGLIQQFECYGRCSNAWTKYLEKLAQTLS
jgi:hypothetical protein